MTPAKLKLWRIKMNRIPFSIRYTVCSPSVFIPAPFNPSSFTYTSSSESVISSRVTFWYPTGGVWTGTESDSAIFVPVPFQTYAQFYVPIPCPRPTLYYANREWNWDMRMEQAKSKAEMELGHNWNGTKTRLELNFKANRYTYMNVF